MSEVDLTLAHSDLTLTPLIVTVTLTLILSKEDFKFNASHFIAFDGFR